MSQSSRNSIVIVGAGPTGLGAAYRLQELGFRDFLLLEAQGTPGGLASSCLDTQGFTWDLGGHVQFSHYDYYDRVLDEALGDQWISHERESWIWLSGRFVPYPFQNNIRLLDPEDRAQALKGLEDASALPRRKAGNLAEWIGNTFGPGISSLFLTPYNFKVWGFPPEQLACDWIGDRVSVPDLERIRRNIEEDLDDVGWGPNRTFRFPRKGGTGAIWNAVCRTIDPARIQFGRPVNLVDPGRKMVSLSGGDRIEFEHLITSIPLDLLCRMIPDIPHRISRAADQLVHSACHIIGTGFRGGQPATLRRKCWMYFPEPESPYYRVTVFSNYSPFNVPPGSGYWSLMAEVCETPYRPVDPVRLPEQVLAAMRRDQLVAPDAQLASLWVQRLEHGYPTPSLGRDQILQDILPWLEARQVWSRGRFGAWRYEVSNQDHSFMQGVEAVNRILGIDREYTICSPDYVNQGAFRSAT